MAALTLLAVATGVVHPGVAADVTTTEFPAAPIAADVGVALDQFAEWLTLTVPGGVDWAIADAAAEFGVDHRLLAEIIDCESGGDPSAYNRSSGASGLGQHLPRYYPDRARAVGYDDELIDPFRPRQNARVSAWLLAQQGTRPWNASKGCWAA